MKTQTRPCRFPRLVFRNYTTLHYQGVKFFARNFSPLHPFMKPCPTTAIPTPTPAYNMKRILCPTRTHDNAIAALIVAAACWLLGFLLK